MIAKFLNNSILFNINLSDLNRLSIFNGKNGKKTSKNVIFFFLQKWIVLIKLNLKYLERFRKHRFDTKIIGNKNFNQQTDFRFPNFLISFEQEQKNKIKINVSTYIGKIVLLAKIKIMWLLKFYSQTIRL